MLMKKYFYTFLILSGLALLSWANIRDVKKTQKESYAFGCTDVLVTVYMNQIEKPKYSDIQDFCNNGYANRFPN